MFDCVLKVIAAGFITIGLVQEDAQKSKNSHFRQRTQNNTLPQQTCKSGTLQQHKDLLKNQVLSRSNDASIESFTRKNEVASQRGHSPIVFDSAPEGGFRARLNEIRSRRKTNK